MKYAINIEKEWRFINQFNSYILRFTHVKESERKFRTKYITNKLEKPKTVKTHPSCNERHEACLSVKQKKTKRTNKCQDLLSLKEAMHDLIGKQENMDTRTENKDRQRRNPSGKPLKK